LVAEEVVNNTISYNILSFINYLKLLGAICCAQKACINGRLMAATILIAAGASLALLNNLGRSALLTA